jgi:hypothetical protein
MEQIYLSLTTRPERLISVHFKKVYTFLIKSIIEILKNDN